MKILSATVLTLALIAPASASFADENQGPLAPGKPAGIHGAQFENGTGMLVVAGAAAIGIGIAIAVSNNNSAGSANNTGSSAVATTSTTP
jgi:hypothetical protein